MYLNFIFCPSSVEITDLWGPFSISAYSSAYCCQYFLSEIEEPFQFGIIIMQPVLESQKLKTIRSILRNSPQITNFVHLLRSLVPILSKLPEKAFWETPQSKLLVSEMNALLIPELNTVMHTLHNPDAILALPIAMEQTFTLFFVVVPYNQRFNWHSHPRMGGISKCIYGSFRITSLDLNQLVFKHEQLLYQKSKQRVEYLQSQTRMQTGSCMQTVSLIYPNSYNIHKIEPLQLSAFFDLLMPDYPENQCQFFDTVAESELSLTLKMLPCSTENTRALDVAIETLQAKERLKPTNLILI